LITGNYEKNDTALVNRWTGSTAAGWLNLPPEPDPLALLSADLAAYPVLVQPRTFSSSVVPLYSTAPSPTSTMTTTQLTGGTQVFDIYIRPGSGLTSIAFDMLVVALGSNPPEQYELRDPSGNLVAAGSSPVDTAWHTISIP